MTPNETSPLLPAEPAIEQATLTRQTSHSSDVTVTPSSSSSSAMDGMSKSTPSSTTHFSFDYQDILRDVIIGFSDGLTVPFALTAGLSSLGSARLVIMGGLAELFSGMISMGLGAYLAAVTERDHYASQEKHRRGAVECMPDAQRSEVFAILERYGVSRGSVGPLVSELCVNRDLWVRFMMDFALRLEEPNVHRAWISAFTMGLSYFIGGLIPMIPYFLMSRVREALFVSIGVTVVVLLGFGYVKNFVAIRNHRAGVWGAVQTLVIGMLAAGTSYLIVRSLDSGEGAV